MKESEQQAIIEQQAAENAQLQLALQAAYDHLDMEQLRLSHCKDAALIDAAIRSLTQGAGQPQHLPVQAEQQEQSVHQAGGKLDGAVACQSHGSVSTEWRELCRRLYVELFHCDQQMMSATDEEGEPLWTQGSSVRDVLRDAKDALAATATTSSPAVNGDGTTSLDFESALAQFTDILGIEESGDLLADARKGIDKLNSMVATLSAQALPERHAIAPPDLTKEWKSHNEMAEAIRHFFEESDGITVWMPAELVQAIYNILAPLPIPEDGFVVMPCDPTDKMFEAWINAEPSNDDWTAFANAYRDMIEAGYTPPAAKEPEPEPPKPTRFLWKWPNGKQEVRDYSEARSFSDWPAEVTPIEKDAPQQEPVAAAIHYPDCWDTAAYPTLADALAEIYGTFRCSECAAPISQETK